MDGRTGLCDAGGCERAVSLCDPAQDPDERSGQNGEKSTEQVVQEILQAAEVPPMGERR